MPTQDRNQTILRRADRRAIMLKLALVDSAEEPFFDRLTDLASKVLGVPVSLVSLVTSTYQFFKSSVGLPEPWQSERRTPLSHSFCQHVVTSGQPLVITDAREHPLVKDNLAIPDLNVIGYLGIPLKVDQHTLGSFCVIDGEPRQWTKDDVAIMQAFADVVNAEIEVRAKAYRAGKLDAHMGIQKIHVDALERDVLTLSSADDIIERLKNFHKQVAATAD